jgi:Holliday junction resolvase RusA-like endonuclease
MVAIAAREHLPQCPIEGPIRLTVRFWLARPKIHYRSGANARKLRPSAPRYPISAKRSDLDNLLKPMMDVLTRLRMWHDDAQVCQHGEGHGKYYVATDVRPGATVTIEEI